MQTSLLESQLTTSLPEYMGKMATFRLNGIELSFEIISVDIHLSRRKTRTSRLDKSVKVSLIFRVSNTNPDLTLKQAASLLTAPVWASIPDLAEGECHLLGYYQDEIDFEFVRNPAKMNQELLQVLSEHLG